MSGKEAPVAADAPMMFPTKILVATDGSKTAARAVEVAVELARSTGSELHLATVRRGYPDPEDLSRQTPYRSRHRETLRRLEREARLLLERESRRIEELGGAVAAVHLRRGASEGEELVRLAEELDPGLVVLGSRGRGRLTGALLGSVSDHVRRNVRLPVLIVRP